MLVDLNLEGKFVAVVGGGTEACRKTLDFLDAGAKILVVSNSFSKGITELGAAQKICLRKEEIQDADVFIKGLDPKPFVVVAVTNDHELNAQLFKSARSVGCIVYSPDNPSHSDIAIPAVAKVGDVKIAVSTSGKSPAMASVLRKRVENTITHEDLLQIELQEQMREVLKQTVADQKTRKAILYQIIEDAAVKELLEKDKFEDAKEKALETIKNTIQKSKWKIKTEMQS